MKLLTTDRTSFFAPPHAFRKNDLFSVNPGVSAQAALYAAVDLLNSVRDVITEAAVGDTALAGNTAFMVSHTLESALATINSVVGQLEIAERSHQGE
ncbi:hypothetical protein QU926_24540 [Pseudomonas asiatica]|uniref:hypothetical protein n=1 Tax=Pseudomonas asiatica TaxID=2219225 RepID=UPI0025AA533E|nr:hypothetical protein [Pseudomonas asiatica]MDM9556787.1 hypothetical protein [Pseudomonas asiatica]